MYMDDSARRDRRNNEDVISHLNYLKEGVDKL